MNFASLKKQILALTTLTLATGMLAACAGQPLTPRPMGALNAPLRRMSAATAPSQAMAMQRRFGKGARLDGTEPMTGENAAPFAVQAALPARVDLRDQFPPVY